MVSNQDICFVQTAAPGEGGHMHSIHQKMANSVGADIQTVHRRPLPGLLNGSVVSDALFSVEDFDTNYDIFVFESPSTLYLLPKLSDNLETAEVVYLHTNVRFAGQKMYPLMEHSLLVRLVGKANQTIDALVLKYLARKHVDGIITVSNLFADDCSDWFDGPISVATPFIEAEKEQKLSQTSPQLDGKQAVYVGHDRGHKGLDILVEAWPAVRRTHPEAELHLYGEDHADWYNSFNGVTVLGYADSLSDAFSGASLFVHPARLDAHPVTPIEAMYGGVPATVTRKTGSRGAVSQVSQNLVVDRTDAEEIASVVNWYFNQELEQRKRMRKRSKQVASRFTESARKSEFRHALQRVIK
ncbi:glycosyltransferase (plasmid) [Natrinema pellirubrum DSM 15624]|uniref:Glycosyltransferase n=1 Tax=Natrinema pellirubrum (strain DSM 15624 / CIP 106293 / JCM 10476 / NCIMB 786 / 157) TaxID=797303 RepID=L0JTF8_NATP1|nr:glycosyltransferase [Natrinema pellirubrum]AGB33681.1 glycosyltransferase [Natrinema pellirubrum DSM 15624]